MTTDSVLAEIAAERQRQDDKWGEQNHADGTGPQVRWLEEWAWTGTPAVRIAALLKTRTDLKFKTGTGTWLDILLEEVAEVFSEVDRNLLRAELIQVAAVAVNWVEAIDRRSQ